MSLSPSSSLHSAPKKAKTLGAVQLHHQAEFDAADVSNHNAASRTTKTLSTTISVLLGSGADQLLLSFLDTSALLRWRAGGDRAWKSLIDATLLPRSRAAMGQKFLRDDGSSSDKVSISKYLEMGGEYWHWQHDHDLSFSLSRRDQVTLEGVLEFADLALKYASHDVFIPEKEKKKMTKELVETGESSCRSSDDFSEGRATITMNRMLLEEDSPFAVSSEISSAWPNLYSKIQKLKELPAFRRRGGRTAQRTVDDFLVHAMGQSCKEALVGFLVNHKVKVVATSQVRIHTDIWGPEGRDFREREVDLLVSIIRDDCDDEDDSNSSGNVYELCLTRKFWGQ